MRRQKSNKPRPLFSSPVPRDVKKPKMKWVILPVVWMALKRSAMALGFMIMLSSLMSLVYISMLWPEEDTSLPQEIVLVLDFEDGIHDVPPEVSFTDPFVKQKPTLRDMISAIEAAKDDERVVGIAARMRDGGFALAHIQEIRAALADFKSSGKFTRIYSSSFGVAGTGLGRYYLASAFEELWMQPMGVVSIAGINADMPFARNILDFVGVKPEFFKRKKYKTAYENITDAEMSVPNREMTQALIDDIKTGLVSDIAADRGLSEQAFEALVQRGMFVSDEALQSGLIDHVDYVDVLTSSIREEVTGDPEDENLGFVSVSRYLSAVDAERSSLHMRDKPSVALVYVVGAIMSENANAKSGAGVLYNQKVAASKQIVPAILDASEDDAVEVIVLRVDSPGGSPVASESILHAVEQAKMRGKKVIVSMGATAASGGYWISAYADKIYVSPMTITGSIGVVGGKFSMAKTWEKIGLNWEGIQWGENANMFSSNSEFSKSGAERMNAMMDHVYKNFLERVSKGRGMSVEEVDKIAGGRVWSGKSALEIGLADESGGLRDALFEAAKLSGAKDLSGVDVVQFPKPKSPIEQFIALLTGEQVSAGAQQQVLSRVFLETFEPVLKPALMARDPEAYMIYNDFSVR